MDRSQFKKCVRICVRTRMRLLIHGWKVVIDTAFALSLGRPSFYGIKASAD